MESKNKISMEEKLNGILDKHWEEMKKKIFSQVEDFWDENDVGEYGEDLIGTILRLWLEKKVGLDKPPTMSFYNAEYWREKDRKSIESLSDKLSLYISSEGKLLSSFKKEDLSLLRGR